MSVALKQRNKQKGRKHIFIYIVTNYTIEGTIFWSIFFYGNDLRNIYIYFNVPTL